MVQKALTFIKKYLFAMASCLYLFALGIFIPRNRALINAICKHFGFKPVTLLVPKISLNDAVPDGDPVQLLELTDRFGNLSHLELMVIAKLVRRQKPRQALEIGTFEGRTTLNIAANCEESATIYTLDLPLEMMDAIRLPIDLFDRQYIDKESSGIRFIGTDYEKQIVQLYGDSATFDFSPYVNSLDFIFIDGSHSYEYVLNDSRVARKLLRDGRGLVIWHDYDGLEGVTRALNELYTQAGDFKGLRHIEETSLVYVLSE